MADIYFLDEAIEDLHGLDAGAQRLVLGKLRKLFDNPEAGQPLGRRSGGNLTGFRKLVVGNREFRVIYRTEATGDICVIWVIANRADDACYELAIARLELLGNAPQAKQLADALQQLRPSVQQVIRIRPDVQG